ncbi:hypothetical protein GCM10011614_11960 [Novosphingobium colocasiae]|uniref:HNH endonuclease n=2 Tax=Novosphingobium colocasiae TaxID=1256513 RepID=A0A918UF31_9SPHN|nr:hypothetical protein GCM10011614_11960 [Novosphingobium colocasiae]
MVEQPMTAAQTGGNGGEGCCWLCARPLGQRVEWHHPIPRSRGGRATVPLHPICHRTIHALFTNSQLAKLPPEPAALADEPAMVRFLCWIASKPPDFHAATARRR